MCQTVEGVKSNSIYLLKVYQRHEDANETPPITQLNVLMRLITGRSLNCVLRLLHPLYMRLEEQTTGSMMSLSSHLLSLDLDLQNQAIWKHRRTFHETSIEIVIVPAAILPSGLGVTFQETLSSLDLNHLLTYFLDITMTQKSICLCTAQITTSSPVTWTLTVSYYILTTRQGLIRATT